MKPYINCYEDVLCLLDDKVEGIAWDSFYEDRNRPAPFIRQNELPDENLVDVLQSHSFRTALELGCGEGRNAIYMAQQGIQVTALDLSPVAIRRAEQLAKEKQAAVTFLCGDALHFQSPARFDFLYDSGLLHHLAPHRRLTYLEQVERLLAPGGYFGLTCFAAGEEERHGAEEVTDWEFYQKRRFGVSFSAKRLEELFQNHLEPVSIRRMRDGVPGTIQGLPFLWAALFRKKKEG